MSDTPERVWVKESHDSWGQYGHWYAHGKGGGTEYVRDNRIVELEAQLRKSALQELSLLGQEIEVTAELEQAEAKIVELEEMLMSATMDGYDMAKNEYRSYIEELEVKLAKAVEALAELATDEHPKGWIAIAAYNELKGQK